MHSSSHVMIDVQMPQVHIAGKHDCSKGLHETQALAPTSSRPRQRPPHLESYFRKVNLIGAKYLNRLAPAVRRARKKAQLHDVKLLKQGREVSSIAEISEPSLALLSPCRAGRVSQPERWWSRTAKSPAAGAAGTRGRPRTGA